MEISEVQEIRSGLLIRTGDTVRVQTSKNQFFEGVVVTIFARDHSVNPFVAYLYYGPTVSSAAFEAKKVDRIVVQDSLDPVRFIIYPVSFRNRRLIEPLLRGWKDNT